MRFRESQEIKSSPCDLPMGPEDARFVRLVRALGPASPGPEEHPLQVLRYPGPLMLEGPPREDKQ